MEMGRWVVFVVVVFVVVVFVVIVAVFVIVVFVVVVFVVVVFVVVVGKLGQLHFSRYFPADFFCILLVCLFFSSFTF